MKIRSIEHNNRGKAFEVRTAAKHLVFPFSKAEPTPTIKDPVVEIFVDDEAGREAFTYVLRSGRTGTVHVEQVLEYNQDPTYLRSLLLYRLALKTQKRIVDSPLAKHKTAPRLGRSAEQPYRLAEEHLKTRVQRGSRARHLVALAKVPAIEPDPKDVLVEDPPTNRSSLPKPRRKLTGEHKQRRRDQR